MFWDVVKQYHGDAIYIEAFLISLCLVCWICFRKGSDMGKKILWSQALALLFIFNEAAYFVIGKLTDATTYYRFFWMLPIVFAIAYILTVGLWSQDRKKKLLSIAGFALCIVVGSNFFLNRTNLHRPQNIYGLDNQAMAVDALIMEDWTGKDEEGPMAAVDMYLEYQIRVYEPQILWGISRKAYLYQAKNGYDYRNGKYKKQQRVIAAVNEGLQEDGRALKKSIDKLGIDYLVIRSEFQMDAYLEEIGIEPVADSGAYTVYRCYKV